MLTRHYRQWVFAASENPYDNFWFGSYNESQGVFTPDPIQSPTDHGLTLALGAVRCCCTITLFGGQRGSAEPLAGPGAHPAGYSEASGPQAARGDAKHLS